MRYFTIVLFAVTMFITGSGCIAYYQINGKEGVLAVPPLVGTPVVVVASCDRCHYRHCRCEQYEYRWQCEICNQYFGRLADQYWDGGRRTCRWCHHEKWPYRAWQCTVCHGYYWPVDVRNNIHRGHNTCWRCLVRDNMECEQGCNEPTTLPCRRWYHSYFGPPPPK